MSTSELFSGRLAMAERVLTPFRVPVFDTLAPFCQGGLSVAAGKPAKGEALVPAEGLHKAKFVQLNNRYLRRGPGYLCWQSGLLRWLEEWQPDALVLDANPRCLNNRFAIRWMRKRGRPVLGWGLGLMPNSTGTEFLRSSGRRRFVRSLDGMFAYSTRGAEQYEAMGMPRNRIFVAKNAATFKPSQPLPPRSPAFGARPIVLFVGKLSDVKRVDNLLRAWQALASTALKPRLQIVGEGPELANLKRLAAKICPEAEFLGPKYGAELDHLFDAADLFVLPGMGGLAIQEAMSHGLPVIVAEADGTQDDLVRPSNGWNIPPNDVAALVNAMRAALADPSRLRAMGAESYRIVAEEININKMVEVFVHGLNTVCNGAASAARA